MALTALIGVRNFSVPIGSLADREADQIKRVTIGFLGSVLRQDIHG